MSTAVKRFLLISTLLLVVVIAIVAALPTETADPAPGKAPDVSTSEQPQKVTPKVKEPKADPTLDRASIEEIYLMTVRDQQPAFKVVDDDLLIETAEVLCEVIDVGGTPVEVLSAGLDSGLTAEQVGTLMGAGIAAFCPEHNDWFDDWASGVSA